MTSEVAVMNKTAIALAADSAVTITTAEGNKTYNTANKLFVLSKYRPIGVMIYGRTELVGVPWETLIKTYRQELSDKRFPTVHDFARHFLEHLSNSMSIFPDKQQSDYVEYTTALESFMLRDDIADALQKAAKASSTQLTIPQQQTIAEKLLKERFDWLDARPNLTSVPSSLESGVLTRYRAQIDKVISGILSQVQLTALARTYLDGIFARRFTRDYFPPGQHTGIVVAGFGDNELFPSVVTHLVSGVVDNTLRYKLDDDKSPTVTHRFPSYIIPFAQSDMVMRFMTGVDPDYLEASNDYIEALLTKYPNAVLQATPNLSPQDRALLLQALQQESVNLVDAYKKDMGDFRFRREVSPILDAVESLPKDELALMAESLITLTSLKQKVSLRTETVGGAVDVAVISKGDGLIWIKRKHYFNPDLNHQFFQNYYRKGE